jgi:hypothetical protein
MPNTFKNYITANVGASATTVLTGATGAQTTVIGMTVANTTTSTVTASVTLTSGATTVFLVKNASVPAGGSLVPIGGDQKVVVEAADVIQVQSSAATSLDVIVSVLEIS